MKIYILKIIYITLLFSSNNDFIPIKLVVK